MVTFEICITRTLIKVIIREKLEECGDRLKCSVFIITTDESFLLEMRNLYRFTL
jgi:hypothetical protein